MRTFKDKIGNVKWLSREPYPMDLAFLRTSDQKDWIEQAKYIQDNLSDADIEKSFKNMPKEVQDETVDEIIRKLKTEKKNFRNMSPFMLMF